MSAWYIGYGMGFFVCAFVTRLTAGRWPWMIEREDRLYRRER